MFRRNWVVMARNPANGRHFVVRRCWTKTRAMSALLAWDRVVRDSVPGDFIGLFPKYSAWYGRIVDRREARRLLDLNPTTKENR